MFKVWVLEKKSNEDQEIVRSGYLLLTFQRYSKKVREYNKWFFLSVYIFKYDPGKEVINVKLPKCEESVKHHIKSQFKPREQNYSEQSLWCSLQLIHMTTELPYLLQMTNHGIQLKSILTTVNHCPWVTLSKRGRKQSLHVFLI